jgi:Spy/CpxP family protein refolding chaperone
MNRTALKWLLALSLSLNAGVIAALVVNQMKAPPAASGARSGRVSLPDYLQLDAGQRQRWAEIEQGFLQDIAANWRDIRAHREALVRQVFSNAPERAAIDAEQARIAALQDGQQRRVIVQLLAERDLLNPRQREMLMSLLLSRYTQEATEEELLHRH